MSIPQLLSIAFIVCWFISTWCVIKMHRSQESTEDKNKNEYIIPPMLLAIILGLVLLLAAIGCLILVAAITTGLFLIMTTAAGVEPSLISIGIF